MSSDHPFVKLPKAVIDHADLDAHELLVYIALLRFRDHKTGTCYPGMSSIADAARMSTKTASRTVNKLEQRGIIQVERVKAVGSKTNETNKYTVGILPDDPMKYLGSSAKGTRVPKRSKGKDSESLPTVADREPEPVDNSESSSDSESLPRNKSATSKDSESLRKDSESLGVRTPSPTKKNHIKKNQEEDMTHAFSEATSDEKSSDIDSNSISASFDLDEEPTASEAQVNYLKDLATILMYQGGRGGSLGDEHISRWRKLTKSEATKQIGQYLKALGRPDEEYYPEPGTPEYEQLSEAGKAFADSQGRPDSVWEYGFRLKENAA